MSKNNKTCVSINIKDSLIEDIKLLIKNIENRLMQDVEELPIKIQNWMIVDGNGEFHGLPHNLILDQIEKKLLTIKTNLLEKVNKEEDDEN